MTRGSPLPAESGLHPIGELDWVRDFNQSICFLTTAGYGSLWSTQDRPNLWVRHIHACTLDEKSPLCLPIASPCPSVVGHSEDGSVVSHSGGSRFVFAQLAGKPWMIPKFWGSVPVTGPLAC